MNYFELAVSKVLIAQIILNLRNFAMGSYDKAVKIKLVDLLSDYLHIWGMSLRFKVMVV